MSWLDSLFQAFYSTIQNAGSAMAQRASFNFIGAAVTDDPTNARTNVDVSASGGAAPPFSRAFYVDAGTAVSVGNDGSVGKPWALTTDALAALPPDGNPFELWLVQGNESVGSYTFNGDFTGSLYIGAVTGTAAEISIGSLDATTGPQLLSITGLQASNIVGQEVFIGDCSVDNATSSAPMILRDTYVSGVIAAGTGASLESGLPADPALEVTGSVVLANGGSSVTHTIAGVLAVIKSTRFNVLHPPIFNFTGSAGKLWLDELTYRQLLATTWIPSTGITNGTLASLPALGGLSVVNFASDANHTLTAAEYAAGVLKFTSSGSLTATRNAVIPKITGAVYDCDNATTGAQAVQVIASTGTGITIANDALKRVMFDGTNVVAVL